MESESDRGETGVPGEPMEPWQRWFHDHRARLFLFARQQTRSAADAEDVLQDAVVRLWRNRDRVAGGGVGEKRRAPPVALAFATVRRCAIDLARKNTRRLRREERATGAPDQDWFESPAPGSTDTAHACPPSAVEAALRETPPKFRDVVTLKIWGELSFAEIGEALGISPNTAASRYRYGLEKIRRKLSRFREPATPVEPVDAAAPQAPPGHHTEREIKQSPA